jgi:hypothetical protein
MVICSRIDVTTQSHKQNRADSVFRKIREHAPVPGATARKTPGNAMRCPGRGPETALSKYSHGAFRYRIFALKRLPDGEASPPCNRCAERLFPQTRAERFKLFTVEPPYCAPAFF